MQKTIYERRAEHIWKSTNKKAVITITTFISFQAKIKTFITLYCMIFSNEYFCIGNILIQKNYSQGCHAGSILQRLSGELAAATRVLTLLSVPSKVDKLVSLWVIAETALVTRLMMTSRSRFSDCCWDPSEDVIRGAAAASTFFLFHAIISSRRIARRMAWNKTISKITT